MKKTLIILGASLVLFSSCVSYSCPTYSSKPVTDKEKQEQRLQYYR